MRLALGETALQLLDPCFEGGHGLMGLLGFELPLLQVSQVAGGGVMAALEIGQVLDVAVQLFGLGHELGFQILDAGFQQLHTAGVLGDGGQHLGELGGCDQGGQRQGEDRVGLRQLGGGRQFQVQLGLQAVQPLLHDLGAPEIVQGVIRVLHLHGHEGGERGDKAVGRDGLMQVEVGPALEALVPGVLLFGRLAADEGHLEILGRRSLPDRRAEGIAFVLGYFHAKQHGGVLAVFQARQGAFRGGHEVRFEGGFQRSLVILNESPIAIHDKETLGHGSILGS